MLRNLLWALLFPLGLAAQGDLSINPSFGINSMTYSLENDQGNQFTFDNKVNYSLALGIDYGIFSKFMVSARIGYNQYSLVAYDSINERLTNNLVYLETGFFGFYRSQADYGLYLGGGPVVWWNLGKANGFFDEIDENSLNNVYGLEVILGYLFRTEGLNAGLELYIDFPLNPAMENTVNETRVTLNASRVAGIRVYLNFMVKE